MDPKLPPTEEACPRDTLLSDFQAGILTDPASKAQVEQHVSTCESCEDRLRRLSRSKSSSTFKAEGAPVDDKALQVSTRSYRHDESRGGGPLPSLSQPSPDSEDELPVRIGDYFVIRMLGSGGYGNVYLAHDAKHNRKVAIKVPRPDRFSSREARDRFLKEARTLAELEHPHIVPLYDCHELEDGRIVVVMKYVEGKTLAGLMASERLSQQRVAELVGLLADALACAHGRRIWHRDVKPANVLIDNQGVPHLTDFGLAISEDVQSLYAGERAGTFPYMSPEQVQGRTDQLDGRSDIWSLGVIFYEMLTRTRPFRGTSTSQIQDEIEHRSPPPLAQYDVSIAPKYQHICLKCLEKDPAKRFSTAQELAEALRPRATVQKFSSRLALTSIAVLLVVVAGFAAGPGRWWNEPPARVDGVPVAAATVPTAPTPDAGSVVPLENAEPLAWATLAPDDYYKSFPESGRFVTQSSAALSCFETHRSTSDHFSFSITADLPDSYAMAGAALGIHESGASPHDHACLSVVFRQDAEDGLWLVVNDCELGTNDLRHPDIVRQHRVTEVKLDDDSLDSVQLELEVKNERVTRLRYNGTPLPDVVQDLAGSRIPTRSACGVMAMSRIVFHKVVYEDLSK